MNEISVSKKEHNIGLDVMKFVACILITNSHVTYPISFLSVGGGQGNGLFFVIAGYLLANIDLSFFEWIWKRISRIVPAVLIGTICFAFLENGHITLQKVVNQYWFCFAILLYYPVYWCVFNFIKSTKGYWITFALWTALYFIIYFTVLDITSFSVELADFSNFKVFFYFGIMLMGGIVRKSNDKLFGKRLSMIYSILGLFGAMLLWGIEYVCVMILKKGFAFQFVIQFSILVFSFCCLYIVLQSSELKNILNRVIKHKILNKLIYWISSATLEVYIVQMTFMRIIWRNSFGVAFVLHWCISLIGGVLMHMCLEKITKKKSLLG
ncbi:MAG: acyltransferase family protein [Lachnospiraceae bacterium]|nr:acyltransferase family protein [Lachnospiraceae bacterium]